MRGAESFMGAGNGICSRTEVLDVGEDLGAEAEALVLGMHDIAHALDVVVLLHLVDVRLEAVRVDRAADDRSGDRLGGVSAELADEAGLDFNLVLGAVRLEEDRLGDAVARHSGDVILHGELPLRAGSNAEHGELGGRERGSR